MRRGIVAAVVVASVLAVSLVAGLALVRRHSSEAPRLLSDNASYMAHACDIPRPSIPPGYIYNVAHDCADA
jgi:hypothetical protein